MIIKRDIYSEPSQAYRTLRICLPDDYRTSEQRYPVMYFLDGQNLFFDEEATYGKSWGLKNFLDTWNKDMIVVGIECGHKENERLSEYLPYSVHTRSFFSKLDAKGDEIMRWILFTLKPMIDTEYPTYPNRECTGIAGSSMGGLMALYGVVKYNMYISKAACLSSAIQPVSKALIQDIQKGLNPDTRIYLSWGTNEARNIKNPHELDMSSYTYSLHKKIENVLLKQNVTVNMYCQIEGNHCEADWEKQNALYMNFLWHEWNVKNI